VHFGSVNFASSLGRISKRFVEHRRGGGVVAYPAVAERPLPCERRVALDPRSPSLAPLFALAGFVAVVLIALAHGYGYHRDELYFLVAGRHLAWSYPDQGPLTPLIARLMSDVAPASLTLLRFPSSLMAGGCVVVSGLIAYEFGGSRRAQLIAGGCMATAPVLLAVGHLLSTSTYDVFAWSVVIWLIVRAIRTHSRWPWLVAGVVSGTALLNKPLIALLLAAVLIGISLAGPRSALRLPWPWLAAAVAAAIWSPWLVWQAHHGWPQVHISSSIASGSSASSQPRWAFIPFQFLLAGPPLAPVWIAGLVSLARRADIRSYRWLAVSWLVLVIAFEVTGGKPYYLSGLLPALFAAGSLELDRWLAGARAMQRRNVLIGALAASGVASALIGLPILPAGDSGLVVAMNSDVGETIGWPEFADELAGAFARAPKPAVIFTANYGEAGADDRFGPRLGLPPAYSGHNAFGYWGPPSGSERSIVAVGLRWRTLANYFRGCQPAGVITNAAGIDNEEQGKLIAICAATREPWSALWPYLKHLS
jgi:hypothetical protein